MSSTSSPTPSDPERPFTVLFGHQSVGRNILAGIEEERPACVRVASLEASVDAPPSEVIVRTFGVGANGDWASKIEHFAAEYRKRADCVDLALFKFCYVDVTSQTCLERLFGAYTAVLDQLSEQHAHTVFGHVTAPLRARDAGLRAALQRLRGRRVREDADNAAREQFNQLLRRRYAPGGALFDLAAVESGDPSERTRAASAPALSRNYTNDGGHLNARGRRIAARAFLQYLESVRAIRCSTQ